MNVLSKCNYSFKEIFHASIYKEPIYMWSSYDWVINISNLHCNVVRRMATLWLEVQTALKYAIYSLFALWVTNYIFCSCEVESHYLPHYGKFGISGQYNILSFCSRFIGNGKNSAITYIIFTEFIFSTPLQFDRWVFEASWNHYMSLHISNEDRKICKGQSYICCQNTTTVMIYLLTFEMHANIVLCIW